MIIVVVAYCEHVNCKVANQMRDKTTKEAIKLTVSPSVIKLQFDCFPPGKVLP